MKEHGALLRVFVATLGCLAMATMGYAQNLEQGQMEASANAGFVTGIGTHTALGGSLGSVVRNRIFAYGEFSYIPIAGGSFQIPTFQTNFDSKGYLFNFGGHYLIGRFRSVGPYLGAGLGILHRSVNASASFGDTNFNNSSDSTDAYFQFGGGARYYVSDRWGFRPEMTIFVGSDSFVRLGAGIFYQFGR